MKILKFGLFQQNKYTSAHLYHSIYTYFSFALLICIQLKSTLEKVKYCTLQYNWSSCKVEYFITLKWLL